MKSFDVESECYFLKQYNLERAEDFFDLLKELNLENVKINDDIDLSSVLTYIEKSNDNLVNKLNKLQTINK